MLKRLKVEQFVIIDHLDLSFEHGFTALTGDTGAGKSILLDAIGIILGSDYKADSIRTGSDYSEFQGTFCPDAKNPVWKFLYKNDLVDSASDEFVIRRKIFRDVDTNDEIAIEGKIIELELLQELGAYLIEIHGQFANQTISDPQNQLNWLDLYGDFDPQIFANVAKALENVHNAEKKLEDEKNFYAENKQHLAKTRKYVERYQEIGMKEGFVEEIEEKFEQLSVSHETTEAIYTILSPFTASQGVISYLKNGNLILERHKEKMNVERVENLTTYLYAALQNAESAVTEMREILYEYETDTSPLHKYEKLMEKMQRLASDTECTVDTMYQRFLDLTETLDRLENGKERIEQFKNELIEAKNQYRHHAQILTEHRRKAAKNLDQAIKHEFQSLLLNNAEFEVKVTESPEIPWTPRGFNEVTYTARMNPGLPFSSIAETSSGGELARMILALKVILQGVQKTSTIIFDEVDTGIGGPAAAAVGERIAKLAETKHVLVITHSPQVASRGQQHLHVSKKSDHEMTTSYVRSLTSEERTDEIARMIAGDKITAESHAAAKGLLDEAKAAADNRRNETQSGVASTMGLDNDEKIKTEDAAGAKIQPQDMSYQEDASNL